MGPMPYGIVDTGGKMWLLHSLAWSESFFFLDPDPHLASVCNLSISLSFEIWVVCVCVCVCVRVREHVCACEQKFGVATNHGKFKVWLGTYV